MLTIHLTFKFSDDTEIHIGSKAWVEWRISEWCLSSNDVFNRFADDLEWKYIGYEGEVTGEDFLDYVGHTKTEATQKMLKQDPDLSLEKIQKQLDDFVELSVNDPAYDDPEYSHAYDENTDLILLHRSLKHENDAYAVYDKLRTADLRSVFIKLNDQS